jgi:hypothetical protein
MNENESIGLVICKEKAPPTGPAGLVDAPEEYGAPGRNE